MTKVKRVKPQAIWNEWIWQIYFFADGINNYRNDAYGQK